MFIYALVLAFGFAVGIGAVASFVIMVWFAEPTVEQLREEIWKGTFAKDSDLSMVSQ